MHRVPIYDNPGFFMHLDKLIEWLENKTLAKVGMIRQTHLDPSTDDFCRTTSPSRHTRSCSRIRCNATFVTKPSLRSLSSRNTSKRTLPEGRRRRWQVRKIIAKRGRRKIQKALLRRKVQISNPSKARCRSQPSCPRSMMQKLPPMCNGEQFWDSSYRGSIYG